MLLTTGLVSAIADPSPTALLFLLFVPLGISLYREYRTSVEIRENALLVRNHFRTREVRRDDIEGFHIGTTGWDPFSESIHVRTRDQGVVELAVTRRMSSLRGGRLSLEQRLDQFTAWKSGPREVQPSIS